MAAPIVPVALAAQATPNSIALPQGPVAGVPQQGFASLLTDGAQRVSDDVMSADRLAREFAVSDSIPVHQVTYALEQARLSLSLMMQVRNRLLEGYQQLMNMQL
jgi:flagellar hook-basal body complex protein FliE